MKTKSKDEVEKTERMVSQKEIRCKQCLKKGVTDCTKMMLQDHVIMCVHKNKFLFICFYGCDRF